MSLCLGFLTCKMAATHRILWRLNGLMHVKHFRQCQACAEWVLAASLLCLLQSSDQLILQGSNSKISLFHIKYRPNSWAWPLGLCWFPPIYFLNLVSIRLPHTPLANGNSYIPLCLRFLLLYPYSFACGTFCILAFHSLFQTQNPMASFSRGLPWSFQQEVIYLPCEFP